MNKHIVFSIVAAFLAGCTPSEQRVATGAAIGGGAGAIIGAAATGTAGGALAGAAIGAASGAVIARLTDRPGYCLYRDQYGREYVARCP